MAFLKPNLLYSYDALEPYIDEATMTVHHSKHHEAYVNGLSGLPEAVSSNTALTELLGGLLNGEPKENHKVLLEFGGGHYNHSLFWEYMSDKASEEEISGLTAQRITNDFGSLENFKKEFSENAKKVFGSGWCWWVYNLKAKKSYIITTINQQNPIMEDASNVCLLGLDVWEHAYYLKYMNKRVDYIESWWNVVNWGLVSRIHDTIAVNGKQVVLSESGYIVFD